MNGLLNNILNSVRAPACHRYCIFLLTVTPLSGTILRDIKEDAAPRHLALITTEALDLPALCRGCMSAGSLANCFLATSVRVTKGEREAHRAARV